MIGVTVALGHHDNRDYNVFPDYQYRDSQSLHEQTTLFGKHEGVGTRLISVRIVRLIPPIEELVIDFPQALHSGIPASQRP